MQATCLFPITQTINMLKYVWLDEDGNHASKDTPGARLTLCYKFSSLLNTDRDGSYYIYAAARIDPGSVNGLNEGRELVDGFINNGGYIDTLLIDRGYIDGATLTHYKKDHKINLSNSPKDKYGSI